MLYDILPPLFFFFSLGGIILLMGRVTMRVRRADFQTNVAAVTQDVPEAPSTPKSVVAKLTGANQAMSDLLQPSERGVRVVKNRMSWLLSTLQTNAKAAGASMAGLPGKIKALPTRQAASKTTDNKPEVEKITSMEETLAPATRNQVVAPQETSRLSGRLKEWGQNKFNTVKQSLSDRRVRQQAKRAEAAAAAAAATQAALAAHSTTSGTSPSIRTRRTTRSSLATSAAVLGQQAVKDVPATERANGFGLLRRARTEGAQSALSQVQDLVAQEAYQRAEDVLLPYIVKNPKDTSAYLLLGEIALKREAWDEAQEVYEQVLRLDSKAKGAYAGLGMAAYNSGNFTKALQMLQRALDEDPTNKEVLEKVLGLAQKMDNPALQHSIEEQLEQLATPV